MKRPGATCLIVLAAGAGSRMKSRLTKPLHRIAGLSMVEHVLSAGAAISPDVTVLVANAQSASIPEQIGRPDIRVVLQDPPRGTGDAVRLGLEAAPECDRCVVLYSDHPLLTGDLVNKLARSLDNPAVRVAVLTARVPDARSYGRIHRDGRHHPVAIVEQGDDDATLREGIIEINSGMMALDAQWARVQLAALPPNPKKGEWYLTDLVAAASTAATSDTGGQDWPVKTVIGEEELIQGVNNRVELAEAEAVLLKRYRIEQMLAGVTIRQPETVTIEAGVKIGADTEIEPHTILRRGTVIGERCVIGPWTLIERSTIGHDVTINASKITDSLVGDNSDVGPWSNLRGNAELGNGVHVGNFVEIKNSTLETGVKAGHVSYLGDASIGANTNIGAGVVTANYDGHRKHFTKIGSNVFIGSDTMLVAPVSIGDGARTGAGSVVTRDVPAGELVVGVPAKPRTPAAPDATADGERNE